MVEMTISLIFATTLIIAGAAYFYAVLAGSSGWVLDDETKEGVKDGVWVLLMFVTVGVIIIFFL